MQYYDRWILESTDMVIHVHKWKQNICKKRKTLIIFGFRVQFFFLVLIEIYQNSFMLRFHVMICDRRSKIVLIIYYNNKCPIGYTIKLRYTDAWYDYVIKGTDAWYYYVHVIKGRLVCLWACSCILVVQHSELSLV